MTGNTLRNVFGTLTIYIPIALLTFALFGWAIQARNLNISPTCAARSPNTIYNPLAKKGKKSKKRKDCRECLNLKKELKSDKDEDKDDVDNDEDHVQYRGGPIFGWIFWVMGLSYEQLLEGVRGTGTRNGGMDGSMLRINLDGIILLRFHALCLRVAVVATALGVCVVLPIYMTARCGIDHNTDSFTCNPQMGNNNITDFELTTIKSLFNLEAINVTRFDEIFSDTEGNIKWHEYVFGSNRKAWRSTFAAYIWRCYGVVIVSWILVSYTIHLLNKEWIGAIALRRIYYFEKNHWQHREKNLNETLFTHDDVEISTSIATSHSENKLDCSDRPLWIPHPEQKNNVPHIELYSVLVENVPSLPNELSYDNEGGNETSIIDWQMKVTTAFFDQCVTNQPGFSSSVAAVTLLPDGAKTAMAWKKWKKYGGALRRLRYIRQLIRERRQRVSQCLNEVQHNDGEQHTLIDSVSNLRHNCDDYVDDDNNRATPTTTSTPHLYDPSKWNQSHKSQYRIVNIFGEEYHDIYHRKIERDLLLPQIESYGPEQTAVLSKEFAMSSMCCPNGCCEEKLTDMSLKELEDMEDELEEKVEESYLDLIQVHKSSMTNISHNDEKQETNDIEMQLNPQHLTFSNQGQVKLLPLHEDNNELQSQKSLSQYSLDPEEETIPDWEKVMLVTDNNRFSTTSFSGSWACPNFYTIMEKVRQTFDLIKKPFLKSWDKVSEIRSTSTVAIVTFTNRQAALAARKCLSDGRGYGRWRTMQDLPLPPLADASVCDITDCRGCCKPVTLTIDRKQKWLRYTWTIFVLIMLYAFWSFPLVIFSQTHIYSSIVSILPGGNETLETMLSEQVPNFYTTLFLAVAPPIFKSLANFSGRAASVSQAEFIALKFFWWFMVLSAFFGQTLTALLLDYFQIVRYDRKVEGIFSLLMGLSQKIPEMSVVWLKWLITKCFVTTPLMIMLNIWAFITIPWKCLRRAILGGGSGTPVPYRIGVDCGFIFFLLISLTPTHPLVCPFVLYYFLYCGALCRRNFLYMYRPSHDSGGNRWPFFADMIVSGLFVAQLFLSVTMTLRSALGPAVLAATSLIPILIHRNHVMSDYYETYMDVALFQSSLVDGWENTVQTSQIKREKFRKFLVDAHKAAYIPICLSGALSYTPTIEPAIVVPLESDIDALSRSTVSFEKRTLQRGAYWKRINSESIVTSQKINIL